MQYTKFSVVVFLLVLSVHAKGQDYNTWYFGQNAGLSFNTIPPTPLSGGQVNTPEGCASISNNAGNILFYTDGLKVWNRNHTIMPNGTGLMGAASSSQSALIVPLPGVSSQYYIFTVTDWIGNGDLRYSIVDMSLNSGNGDVIAASKNTFLSTAQTEKLVAANSTSCGIWILTHQRNTNGFEARLVTATGINPPVFSNVGTVHNTTPIPPNNYNNLTGVMKVSKNNQKIGLSTLGRIVQLFDFNATTGQVSNPISLTIPTPKEGYGVCFSPDNSKFYINECYVGGGGAGYDIFQYDITSSNSTTINNSKTFVGRATTPVVIVGEMQIGPDNKIYCTKQGTNFLGIIPNPNVAAPGCGFINNGISLAAGMSQSGLPNEIRKGGLNITVNLGNDTTLCPGNSLTLTAPSAPSYLWSTGAVTQSISVTLSGQYWVMISNGACTNADTINVLFAAPSVNLGNDTTLCTGQSLTLNAGSANSYLWSTGATSQTINVNTPGQYWVNASNGTCFDIDTINVSFATLPIIFLGNDSTLCTGQSITLNAGSAASYLWSTGATSQTISVTTTGQYWVRISNGTCFNADTINIAFNTPPVVNLGNDTTLCTTQSIVLNAGAAGSYLWSTGATSQTINVNTPGQYWVRASNGNCANSDTINVSFVPPPVINLGNDSTLCTGQSIILNAGSAASYLWSTGATSQTISVTAAGQYWVRISNGTCFNADTINIAFNTPPIVNLGNDTTLCTTQSIILNAGAAGSYLWSTGATSQTINVNIPGQYWVKASNGNCFNTDTINVSFVLPPIINLGNDSTLCTGQSIILNAGSAAGYLWSTGATTQSIIVTTTGQYWVRISNGPCFNADTINIAFNAPPIVNLGIDTTLCTGQLFTLNAGTAGSYLWSTGATSQIINISLPGQYWVRASNVNCINTDTINILYAPPPVVDLGKDSTLCQGQNITLTSGNANSYLWSTGQTLQTINVIASGQYWVKASNGNCSRSDTTEIIFKVPPPSPFPASISTCNNQLLILDAGNANKYLWSTADTTRTIKIVQEGNYRVTINYFNNCQTQYATLVKYNNCACELFVPNAFTPDNNGKNDLFKPARRSGCQFLKFTVYNRWGQKVFETADLDIGWDGKYSGKDQPSGIYIWQIFALVHGKQELFNGTAMLIR